MKIKLFFVWLAVGTAGWAQSGANSGQIVGQVLDPSAAAISGAGVSILNKDTHFKRTATTDKTGRYAVSDLPLGPYVVSVNANGFETSAQDALVTLGSSVSVNFSLPLAGKTESLEVTGNDVPGLEPTTSAPKSILTDLQIHELPSQGRRLQNMVVETPAAIIEPECRGFSISGQKGIYSYVSIDGGDYDSTWGCGIRARSESAPTFGLGALQEVEVIRNTFSAEFGRSTGGQIQMSTKSGTNEFHGSGFYLFRDGTLSALNAFGQSPIATVNQFGGSVGGPIQKNRTFFFSDAEFQFGSKPVQVIYSLLNTQGLSNTPSGQALLAAAPEGTFSAISNSQSVINRVDHTFSGRNSFFGRFDFTRTLQTNSPGATNLSTGLGLASTTTSAASNQVTQPDSNYTVLGQVTSVLSSTLLNEFRVQFSREVRPRINLGEGPQVTVNNTQNGSGGTVAIYGTAPAGSWGNLGFASTDNREQAVENLSIVNGAHTAKIGVDYQYISGSADYNQTAGGAYTFNSLAAYLARSSAQYTQFTGSGLVDLTIQEVGAYIQDEWRIRPGLTINPGFRYEAQVNPNYYPATAAQNRYPGATSIPSDTTMFAPRLGIAWDVANNDKTVIRAGGGLFYAPTYASLFAQSLLFNGGNPDRGYSVSITNPTAINSAFQSVGVNLATAPLNNLPVFSSGQYSELLAAGTGLNSVSYFDPHFRNPRALQWQIGMEHQFARGITLSENLSYINTVGVARERDTNLGPPVVDSTGRNIYSNPRPDPQFGVTAITEPAGRSLYRGMTTSLNVRRSRYTIDVYYTLSWNVSYDDAERGFTSIRYADVNDIRSEYGYSNLDERHQFQANGNYFLPHGFEIGTTMHVNSGMPYSALVGYDINLDGQNTDRPVLNGAMLRRNTFRNYGFKDISLRVQKNFRLYQERKQLSISAEFFNLANFANVQLAGAAFTYGAGQMPLAAFGQLRNPAGQYYTYNVAGDPFQAQLGLRFRY
ncbi:MAG: TonB-dependent receptor [Acidobacteriia bacterium]|nr:TonB-dependent receptor [Terriglobia bacterium]